MHMVAELLTTETSRSPWIRYRKYPGCAASFGAHLSRGAVMSVRPALSVAVALATAAVPLALASPSHAATDATKVVISEVYGGGGAAASTWSRDYVELYNPTDQAVDLSGTSVQYRSASGTANPSGVTALSGSIPAKGYFLVG